MVVTGAINLCQFVTKLILENFEIWNFSKNFLFLSKSNFENLISETGRNWIETILSKMTLDRRSSWLRSSRKIWLMRKCYKYYIFNVTRVTYKNLIVKQWFGLKSGSKWLTVVCEMNQVTRVKWLDLVKPKKVLKVQIERWSVWSVSVSGLGKRRRQPSMCQKI